MDGRIKVNIQGGSGSVVEPKGRFSSLTGITVLCP